MNFELKKTFFNKVLHHRFLKFGLVGGSGIPINLTVLYLCQEYFLKGISSTNLRLNIALGIAIFIATASNFICNRLWTWGDRRQYCKKHLIHQFFQYALGCWVAIAIQVICTKLFTIYFYYILANFLAILIACVFNFTVHSLWTFRKQSQ